MRNLFEYVIKPVLKKIVYKKLLEYVLQENTISDFLHQNFTFN